MNEPIFDYVLLRLERSKGRWPAVAEASGVPYKTLTKIAQREIQDPGVSHIQKLADYFRACEIAHIEAGVRT
jgi:hypothetical protein